MIYRDALWYFFIYSCGASPVILLKMARKVFRSLYPASYMVDKILRSPLSICFFADSILTRCKYSNGLFLVASLNRLIKFRLLILTYAAIFSTEISLL